MGLCVWSVTSSRLWVVVKGHGGYVYRTGRVVTVGDGTVVTVTGVGPHRRGYPY